MKTIACDECGTKQGTFYLLVSPSGESADLCSPTCITVFVAKVSGKPATSNANGHEVQIGAPDSFAHGDLRPQKGPCMCPSDRWKMSNPPRVICSVCGATWEAQLDGPPKRRPGRPRKVQPGDPPPVLPGQEPMFKAAEPVIEPEPPPAETPVRDFARVAVNEPPRWCGCGAPFVWDGKAWTCSAGHAWGAMPELKVATGIPGENLSQLVADLKTKRDFTIKLTDLAEMIPIRRDLLRAWAEHGGDPPGFLSETPEPAPAPAYAF